MSPGWALRCAPVALVLVATLGVSGCSGGSGAPPAPTSTGAATGTADPSMPPAADLSLASCDDQVDPLVAGMPGSDRDLTFDCGTMLVPLDYSAPGQDTLGMFVVRARLAGQHDRIGALLVNPGGPGGSGSELALNLALTLPIEILERFDLVGFDPRGVSMSTAIHCIPDAYKDQIGGAEPYGRTDAEFAVQVDIADTIGSMCFQAYGPDLGAFDTPNTARDMDQLREALGEDTLTYLGYSYGTRLGATYADLFPDRVRALVLDGAVDPTLDDEQTAESQIRGFEGAFDAFAADCVARACPAGADPRATVTALIDAARTTPIPSSTPGETRRAGPGHVLTAVQSALYRQDAWPTLAEALAEAQAGDAAGILALADQFNGRNPDGTYDNSLDANLTVNCADDAQTATDPEIRAYAATMGQRYPLFGTPIALNRLVCSHWQAPRVALPDPTAQGAPPIMVVGTTDDPATPYSGAQALAGSLSSGFLVSWHGEGHTAYPKTPCVTAAVDAYLIDLTVPAADPLCPPG